MADYELMRFASAPFASSTPQIASLRPCGVNVREQTL